MFGFSHLPFSTSFTPTFNGAEEFFTLFIDQSDDFILYIDQGLDLDLYLDNFPSIVLS